LNHFWIAEARQNHCKSSANYLQSRLNVGIDRTAYGRKDHALRGELSWPHYRLLLKIEKNHSNRLN
jgi:hypothetical protein